jgi:hypothetical protein
MAGTNNLQAAGALRKNYVKQYFPNVKLKPNRESRDPWMGQFAGTFLGDNYYVYECTELPTSKRAETMAANCE